MKKAAAILIVVLSLMMLTTDVEARTMWNSPADARNAQLTFLRVKDEYMVLYNAYARQPANTVAIRANFWTDFNQQYYEQIYYNPDGVLYLTCNGTYIIEYLDSSQNVIAETRKLITTKIQNPPCQSYQQGGLQNDKNLTAERSPDGNSTTLRWDSVPNAAKYDVYANGEDFLGSTTDTNFTTNNNANNYTVVASDSNGNVISTSDYYSDNINDNLDDGSGDGGSGGCNACEKLTAMLQCPAWDDYMGELTQAIQNALPPPTDWDMVAGKFVNHFSDYFGQVPAAPTINNIKQAIEPQQPVLNTTVEGSDMTPLVPSDFNNGALDTSITDGEQIEIIQDSQAFEIYEPTEFLEHDDVGVFVYPNDERNSSNGIQTPQTITTDYEQPQPQQNNDSSIPPNEQPQPQIPHSTIPLPNYQNEIIPIPQKME